MLLLSTIEFYNPPAAAPLKDAGFDRSMRQASILPVEPFTKLPADELRQVKISANNYGLDYRLILALMRQESQFDRDAVSEAGASGLMQIMPVTNGEIADALEIEEPQLPRENIRAGVYYFSYLYDLFESCPVQDRIQMALAAYNAGPARIYDAQELAAYMGENPNEWVSIQNMLPLLSKRYYSLHQGVWKEGKPRAGYFGSWRQTVRYVDRVMSYYDEFQKTLPAHKSSVPMIYAANR